MATGVEIAIQHVAETAVQTAADTVIDSSGTALAMADGVGIRALAIALGINMCVAITCFLLLSLFRALKLTRKFYAPKRHAPGIKERPAHLPSAPLLYLWRLWWLPEREIIRVAGVDTAVYLRLVTMGLHLSLLLSIWCCAVVLPVNSTGHEVERLMAEQPAAAVTAKEPEPAGNETISSRYQLSDFDRFSLSNIAPGSSVLWVHLGATCVVVLLTLHVLWRHSRDVVALRLLYLTRAPRGGPSHTVLFTDIPGSNYGTRLQRTRSWLATASLARFLLPKPVRRRLQTRLDQVLTQAAHGFQASGRAANKAFDAVDDLFPSWSTESHTMQQMPSYRLPPGPSCALAHGSPATVMAGMSSTVQGKGAATTGLYTAQSTPQRPFPCFGPDSNSGNATVTGPSSAAAGASSAAAGASSAAGVSSITGSSGWQLDRSLLADKDAQRASRHPYAWASHRPQFMLQGLNNPAAHYGMTCPLGTSHSKPATARNSATAAAAGTAGTAIHGGEGFDPASISAPARQTTMPQPGQLASATGKGLHGQTASASDADAALHMGAAHVALNAGSCGEESPAGAGAGAAGMPEDVAAGVDGSQEAVQATSRRGVPEHNVSSPIGTAAAAEHRSAQDLQALAIDASVGSGEGEAGGAECTKHDNAVTSQGNQAGAGCAGTSFPTPYASPYMQDSMAPLVWVEGGEGQHPKNHTGQLTVGSASRPAVPLDRAGSAQLAPLHAQLANASPREVLSQLSAWSRAQALMARGMSYEEMVSSEVARMLPGARLVALCVLRDESCLTPAADAYTRAAQALEDLLDHYTAATAKGWVPQRKKLRVVGALHGAWAVALYGARPVRVDALRFWQEALQASWSELVQAQQALQRALYLPTAFVTFDRRWYQAVASTSLLHHDESIWRCAAAPEPAEVLWAGLGMRLWERQTRTVLLRAAYSVLLLTYAIPVSALQAGLQISRLESIKALRGLLRLPLMRSLLGAILPGLVLRLLVLTMPIWLRMLVWRAGPISLSEVDVRVTTLMYIFLVVAVFASSFIAGALLNQLTQLLNDPSTVLAVIGAGAPQTATFFINYILTNALVLKPIFMLRLPQLFVFSLRYGLAATARARARLWQKQVITFGWLVPDHSLVILLGVVFSCIQPLLLPVCSLYFVAVYLIESHQHMYVWAREYESGGRMWSQVFVQVMVGVYMQLLVMAALLAVKRFPFTPLILLPAAVAVTFHLRVTQLLHRPYQVLSLSDAADLDSADKAQEDEQARTMPARGKANGTGTSTGVGHPLKQGLLENQHLPEGLQSDSPDSSESTDEDGLALNAYAAADAGELTGHEPMEAGTHVTIGIPDTRLAGAPFGLPGADAGAHGSPTATSAEIESAAADTGAGGMPYGQMGTDVCVAARDNDDEIEKEGADTAAASSAASTSEQLRSSAERSECGMQLRKRSVGAQQQQQQHQGQEPVGLSAAAAAGSLVAADSAVHAHTEALARYQSPALRITAQAYEALLREARSMEDRLHVASALHPRRMLQPV